MLRILHNSLGQRAACLLPRKIGATARIVFYALYTLCTTCDAATLSSRNLAPETLTPPLNSARHQQLSEVWREAFPLAGDELAPSSFSRSLPTSKPTAPWAGVRVRSDRPHPAVARIVVPEQGAISYGSGTLIDVRDNFGLVITNWHVVRDASDTIEVVFPDGFTSKARALKVDADWDLAALVVWRPKHIEPVSIAAEAPRPGDRLTICGYGPGNYRCATGRCTQYYAPRLDFPRHMVELDVEARQGDSGGPIFNDRGELAGVLFGAGQGTTLGSFGGRVGAFLATLAPDIGQAEESLADNADSGAESFVQKADNSASGQSSDDQQLFANSQRSATIRPHSIEDTAKENTAEIDDSGDKFASDARSSARVEWPQTSAIESAATTAPQLQVAGHMSTSETDRQLTGRRANLFEQMKTALAAVGLVTVVVQMLRVAR